MEYVDWHIRYVWWVRLLSNKYELRPGLNMMNYPKPASEILPRNWDITSIYV